MKIEEAIKKAMESGRGLYRIVGEMEIVVFPTNSPYGMIIGTCGEKGLCQNWNPRADDLLATDWELF